MIIRKLFQPLKAHLTQPEITLLIGPRQTGKTMLMRLLQEHVACTGGPTVFLNLDIDEDRRFFDSQLHLLRKIQLEIAAERGVVFIDEIQRREDTGLFLKGLYDEEFVHFKTEDRYGNRLEEFFIVHPAQAEHLLTEYLQFGGYPRIVMEERRSEKRLIMQEIYQSYLERDIAYMLHVEKTEDFGRLLTIIASQTGQPVNIAKFSRTLGLAQATVRKYLWYLEKTFILYRVLPYFTNIRKEITKAPVYYFYDPGLRNFAHGRFGEPLTAPDAGWAFQNFVGNVLHENTTAVAGRLRTWRKKGGTKVDFVVETGETLLPVEVKYAHIREPRIPRSLQSFIRQYRPKTALIVNRSLEATVRQEATEVRFIPFTRLIANGIAVH